MVIFFDLDDTLIDHTAAVRSAASSMHTKLGLDGSKQDFIAAWQAAIDIYYPLFVKGEMTFEASRRARIRKTIDSGLTDTEADRLFANYLASYESAWSLFPDVLPCLGRLASVHLGVITNGQTIQQREKLTRFDLARCFQFIFISEECGLRKPEAGIFSMACRYAGVSPLKRSISAILIRWMLAVLAARDCKACGSIAEALRRSSMLRQFFDRWRK